MSRVGVGVGKMQEPFSACTFLEWLLTPRVVWFFHCNFVSLVFIPPYR